MKHYSPTDLSLALLPHRTPLFSALIDALGADASLAPIRKRDMISGLRCVAAALGQDASNVPADPTWLRPRIAKVSPAAQGLKPKTWANHLSNARAALAHSGIVTRRTNRQHDLSPAWRSLWAAAQGWKKIHGSLARFVYFLDKLGVPPTEVSNLHVTAFREALMADEIRKNPEASLRNAINSWNRAVDHAPGWPQMRLDRLPPKVRRIKRPLSSYPPSFAADLERFRETVCKTDFLSDPAARPLAPSSALKYSRVLERVAGAQVETGVAPEEITCIEDIFQDARLTAALRWYHDRFEGEMTRGFAEVAIVLQQVGRRYLGRDAQPLLDRLVRNLPSKPQGLTEKNRERLRAMRSPEMARRIVSLPECLMARAGTDRSHRACILRENAVALAILLYCPIRRGNLAAIDLTRHIVRPGDGRSFLVIPAGEVKNRVALEFELPPSVTRMIDRHVKLRSPKLCPAGTPFLFPKRDGSQAMAAEHLAINMSKLFRRELGLEVNLHIFRHFAALTYLDAAPGNYEAARRLLGHRQLTSTINAYTGIETAAVSQHYADIIEGLQA